MVTMVRGKTTSLKQLLNKHGFLWSDKGYWTRTPAYNADARAALETEIRQSGASADLEIRNIKREWA
jgi:hypothetical protein